MLESEFNYYLKHQDDLLPLYNGKFIVIRGEEVVGAYTDRSDAYYSSLEKYEPGTFIITDYTLQ